YRYIRNHKKTIKIKQARTRERKSKQKPEAKARKSKSWGFIKLREKLGNSKAPKDYGRDKSVKSKPSLTQDQAHATSIMEKAQIHMGFCAKTLTKEAQ
ncbi:hypothetical protein Tco_1279129, partial [Tanacetum coccineum]